MICYSAIFLRKGTYTMLSDRRLSLKEKLIYSSGNGGVGIFMGIHMWYLVYFFFPPKDAGLPYVIPQKGFFLGITVLGLIMAIGRLFDAITDPIIANRSDNSTHKRGKRVPYLRRYSLFMALTYLLVFFVPITNTIHPLNILWLTIFLLLSALGLTLYSVPFFSLMIQIAEHPDDKIDLGTTNSAFWFSGFLLASFATILWKPLQQIFYLTPIVSVQVSFAIIGFIGLLLLFIPAFFLDERKYRKSTPSSSNDKVPLILSMKKVMRNKDFRYYLMSNTSYTVATYMFETGLIYYLTVLAMRDQSIQGPLTALIGGATLLSYPLVNALAKKKGKKTIIKLGFFLFCLSFLTISLFGLLHIPVVLLIIILGILAPIPQAIFGIIPTVMVADCAAYDQWRTGEDCSGMYVAVNGFFVKVGYSIATILFTSLLLFGKDPGDDLGIRLTSLLGAGLAFLSIGLITKYNEKRVMAYSKAEKKLS